MENISEYIKVYYKEEDIDPTSGKIKFLIDQYEKSPIKCLNVSYYKNKNGTIVDVDDKGLHRKDGEFTHFWFERLKSVGVTLSSSVNGFKLYYVSPQNKKVFLIEKYKMVGNYNIRYDFYFDVPTNKANNSRETIDYAFHNLEGYNYYTIYNKENLYKEVSEEQRIEIMSFLVYLCQDVYVSPNTDIIPPVPSSPKTKLNEPVMSSKTNLIPFRNFVDRYGGSYDYNTAIFKYSHYLAKRMPVEDAFKKLETDVRNLLGERNPINLSIKSAKNSVCRKMEKDLNYQCYLTGYSS